LIENITLLTFNSHVIVTTLHYGQELIIVDITITSARRVTPELRDDDYYSVDGRGRYADVRLRLLMAEISLLMAA